MGGGLYKSWQGERRTGGYQNRMIEPKVKKSAPQVAEIRTKKNLKNNLKKCLTNLKPRDIINEFTSVNETRAYEVSSAGIKLV